MKKGQICEGVIEVVEFPNKAVIPYIEKTLDGKERMIRVSAKGGIPGQRVSFVVKKARKENCKGLILEILEKSPLETKEPVCPKFGLCGGCSYQTIPYEKQLELKKNQVLKLMEGAYHDFLCKSQVMENSEEKEISDAGMQAGDVLTEEKEISEIFVQTEKISIYDGILGSPDIFEYRNKMEFSFGDEFKDGPLTLGLHKKGSFHDILDADGCQIVHEDVRKILVCVRDYCREKRIPYYKKNSHEGILRHLLVRHSVATGELLAGLVISSQRMTEWDGKSDREIWGELVERLRSVFSSHDSMGTLAGILLILNDSLGDVVQSDRMEILYGRDFIVEEILGLKFKITPFSFFQTNSKGAEVLYRRARDYILGNFHDFSDRGFFADDEALEKSDQEMKNCTQNIGGFQDKVVFDLYSGTGTIAQMIAPVVKKVIGVEIVEEAVKAARENAALNGLTNCEFIAGDVLKVLDEMEEKPDLIILDPPRDGIHPKVLPKIIAYGVEQIVYISCKPTSLARDLVVFLENGYEMKRMSNVDMFPGTVHVETVCLLGRRKPDDTIKVSVNMDDYYQIRDAEEAEKNPS